MANKQMQGDTNQFLDDFNKLSEETQYIVCMMAMLFDRVSEQNIRWLIYSGKIHISKNKLILKELNKFSPYVFSLKGYSSNEYILTATYGLQLFRHIITTGKLEDYTTALYNSQLISWNYRELHKRLINCLFSFLEIPDTALPVYKEVSDLYHPEILLVALNLPEFRGLELRLPFSTNLSLFRTCVIQYSSTLQKYFTIDKLYDRLRSVPGLSKSEMEYYSDLYAIPSLLIPGKLNEIPACVSCNTPVGLFLHAVYHQQIRKDLPYALKLYERGIKEDKKDTSDILPQYPIISYTYAQALCQANTPESIKKINTLLKKKAIKENPNYTPAFLLFALKTDQSDESILNYLSYNRAIEFSLPIIQLLANIIFKSSDKDSLNATTKIKYPDSFNGGDCEAIAWLESEYLSVYPEHNTAYKELSARLGYPALMAGSMKEEIWEKALDLLINTYTPTSRTKTKVAPTKTSRVAYLINMEYHYIEPILQTSTDQVNWTTGRTISLLKFLKGELPNPTEADLRISKAINVHKGYYGKLDCDLSFDLAIPFLIGHPALYIKADTLLPLELVAAEPTLEIKKDKQNYKLTTNVTDINVALQLTQETKTRYQVLVLNTKQREIINTLIKIPTLPLQAKDKLLQFIALINEDIQVYSDLIDNRAGALSKITADSRVIVQLQPSGMGLKAELFIKPFATQPPYCRAGQGAKSILATINGVKSQALRLMDKEIENRNNISYEFQQITEATDESSDSFYFETPIQSLEMLERLNKFTDIASVEWPEAAKYKVTPKANFQSLSFIVKTKNNWLELSGELKVDEELVVSIQTLLSALKKSTTGRFVELGQGEYLALTEQLRKQLSEIEAAATFDKKGNILLPQFSAPIVDNFSDSGAIIKGDTHFKALLTNIKNTQTKEYIIPKQLKAELREYQAEGFRWMARLADWGAGACLADDMGLGKTIQAIAMLLHKATEGASLVICPASVLLNWKREINRFAPSLRTLVLNEATDREAMLKEAGEYDVVLVTFGLIINEEKLITGKNWAVTALDEAHTIKNKETKASKVAMQLQSGFRLLLTGTPIQNHLGEVWNLFSFITPGLLGSFDHFTEYFINPITQDKDKNRQKQLKKFITPFLLRRTKQAVLDELPSKTEILKEVELSEEEKAYYEALRREAEISTSQTTASERLKVLAEITKLRMAACNVNLVNKGLRLKSSKTEVFLEIVDELTENGHRSLVFSQFTSELALIKEALDEKNIEYLYLDGSVTIPNREKLVKEFQTGTVPIFLISLKAGGLGLNLTAADFVIHLDPWWNPAIEDQASDRVHRIGQERPVTIYRLIAQNTIEEKIIRLHTSKRDLADSLLEGSDLSAQLTRDELMELLKQ